MKIELNNETLTAYVLGELEAEERKAVQAALATDEHARKALDEIRATIDLAHAAYVDEVPVELTADQRGEIEQLAEKTEVIGAVDALPESRSRARALVGFIGVAAALAIVTTLWAPTAMQRESMFMAKNTSTSTTQPTQPGNATASDLNELREQLEQLGYLGDAVVVVDEGEVTHLTTIDHSGTPEVVTSNRMYVVTAPGSTTSSSSHEAGGEVDLYGLANGNDAQTQAAVEAQTKLIRDRIEAMKLLPAGADPSGIKPYRLQPVQIEEIEDRRGFGRALGGGGGGFGGGVTDIGEDGAAGATFPFDLNGDGIPEDIPFNVDWRNPLPGVPVVDNTVVGSTLGALVSPGPPGAIKLGGIITNNEDGDGFAGGARSGGIRGGAGGGRRLGSAPVTVRRRPTALDAENLEQLVGLGYLGESVASPAEVTRLVKVGFSYDMDDMTVADLNGEPTPKREFIVRNMFVYKPGDRYKVADVPDPRPLVRRESPGTEDYDGVHENRFLRVTQRPLSTFSIDVDTAAYTNLRRFLNRNTLPPKDAVRIEEMINYFSYDYAPPEDKSVPFAAHMELAEAPWAPEHRLVQIALKGWEMDRDERPATNLVFLLDVSGSMSPDNKLPLVKRSMKLLTRQLTEADSVAIVVYAGSSGLVLPSTTGDRQEKILGALDRLKSGGSTNGGAGIRLAYNLAIENFIEGGVNRVILATDGDFNVGTTNQGELIELIQEKAKSGVFLSVFGFGMGNLKDATLEKLADKGNGTYGYIDTYQEARKVFVDQLNSTLVTIAKDVKIQVEFNPAKVLAYRLIGYENRIMAARDFNDDTKDAGEIGAGHTVTALYEIVPTGIDYPARGVDPLKYQEPAAREVAPEPAGEFSDELLTLKLRYKEPDGDTSKLIEFPLKDSEEQLRDATTDFKFAASVASFGMLLRGSRYSGDATINSVLELAEDGMGRDTHGYRAEFIDLVRKAKDLYKPRRSYSEHGRG